MAWGISSSREASSRRPARCADDSYELPFRFTGTINKLTFKLGPSQMTVEEQQAAAEAIKKATD